MIRSKIDESCLVENIPQITVDYFNALSVVPDTNFVVAGYDSTGDGKKQLLYKVNVKNKTINKVDTTSQGASWDGETFTLSRLVLTR